MLEKLRFGWSTRQARVHTSAGSATTVTMREGTRTGSPTAVVVQGELDYAESDVLRSALAEAERSGQDVLLDLGGTTFIDTACVGVVEQESRRIGEAGHDLTVHVINPLVRRVFALSARDGVVRLNPPVSP